MTLSLFCLTLNLKVKQNNDNVLLKTELVGYPFSDSKYHRIIILFEEDGCELRGVFKLGFN